MFMSGGVLRCDGH